MSNGDPSFPTSKNVTLDTATVISLPIDEYNRLVEDADKNFDVWVNTNKRWASTYEENKRLQAALEQISRLDGGPGGLAGHQANIARAALSGEPSAYETEARRHLAAKRPGEARRCWCGTVHLDMQWGEHECQKCDGEGCDLCNHAGLAVKESSCDASCICCRIVGGVVEIEPNCPAQLHRVRLPEKADELRELHDRRAAEKGWPTSENGGAKS